MRDALITISEDEYTAVYNYSIFEDDGTVMGHLLASSVSSVYGKGYVKTLTIGGLEIEPLFRRRGYAGLMINNLFEKSAEMGWEVAALHTVSYNLYRKNGFEKICDTVKVTVPLSQLKFIEPCWDLVLLTEMKQIPDVLAVFQEFSRNRNVMFFRGDDRHYSVKPGEENRYTYIWYNGDGNPRSYITKSHNHGSKGLDVQELAFTDRESMYKVLGLLRMYEGQAAQATFQNIAMMPEVDFVLREYTANHYELFPDVMGRILNVESVLRKNNYPQHKGSFTVGVNDYLDFTRGVYGVEYESGQAVKIEKLSGSEPADLEADMPAFTQMVYGYASYSRENVQYMHGVTLNNSETSFFEAFPKRNNGLFEHF